MKVKTFVCNAFFENTYVVSSEKGNAVVIDPGFDHPSEWKAFDDYVNEERLKIVAILNTHCHIDHVLGVFEVKKHKNVPFYIPFLEKEVHHSMQTYAPSWGIHNYQHVEADKFLQENEVFDLDELSFQLLFVPGHSPGHMAFYLKEEASIFSGDVLFRESIGRTDLPGGNHEQLLQSIRKELFVLADGTVVYAGHGPTTTIGYEKKNNHFLKT